MGHQPSEVPRSKNGCFPVVFPPSGLIMKDSDSDSGSEEGESSGTTSKSGSEKDFNGDSDGESPKGRNSGGKAEPKGVSHEKDKERRKQKEKKDSTPILPSQTASTSTVASLPESEKDGKIEESTNLAECEANLSQPAKISDDDTNKISQSAENGQEEKGGEPHKAREKEKKNKEAISAEEERSSQKIKISNGNHGKSSKPQEKTIEVEEETKKATDYSASTIREDKSQDDDENKQKQLEKDSKAKGEEKHKKRPKHHKRKRGERLPVSRTLPKLSITMCTLSF